MRARDDRDNVNEPPPFNIKSIETANEDHLRFVAERDPTLLELIKIRSFQLADELVDTDHGPSAAQES